MWHCKLVEQVVVMVLCWFKCDLFLVEQLCDRFGILCDLWFVLFLLFAC